MKMMLEEVAKERLTRIGLKPNLSEPLTKEGIMDGRCVRGKHGQPRRQQQPRSQGSLIPVSTERDW